MTSQTPVNAEPQSGFTGIQPTAAVVITTYNHADYLSDAISSSLAQTRPADEIIVVDDGSDDDPAAVVEAFPGVRLLRQHNQGLAAARNAGLAAARSDFIVFLDADDRLLPAALAVGLEQHGLNGDCALIYGGHRYIAADGTPFGVTQYTPVRREPYIQLLEGNTIGMHATAIYRRVPLVEAGGFDANLRRCEDYDVYLRLARSHRIGSHPVVVAEYRKHGRNMSADHGEMLRHTLRIQERAATASAGSQAATAARNGRRNWREYYAGQMLSSLRRPSAGGEQDRAASGVAAWSRTMAQAWQASPRYVAKRLVKGGLRRAKRLLGPYRRPVGRIRFGDLGETAPVDANFGYGRGTPIDRFYIERFLQTHQAEIAGRVLEIGDDSYSRRFGGNRITRQDVLHVHAGNPAATIVGDLSMADVLPDNCFHCVILTQTLHLVYDMRAALAHLHAALRPGGVLLLTVPGVSSVDRHSWGGSWYWSLTQAAVHRLLQDQFGAGVLSTQSVGNVLAATCFLQGLALEDVTPSKLLAHDPAYPVLVTALARKAAQGEMPA